MDDSSDSESVTMPPPPNLSTPASRSGASSNSTPTGRPTGTGARRRLVAPSTPSIPPTPDDSVVPSTPAAAPTQDDDPGTPLTPLSQLPDMDEDDDDDDQHNEQQQQPELPEEREPLLPPDANTLIRGTDVHVPTAAAAFEHFLLHFVSLQQAERANNDNDADDNHNDLDSIDSSQQNKEPLYLTKLQDILTNGGVVSEDDERTSSLDIDTMHLFYHSPDCQRFYQQLLSYPMELVPLMDLLIKRQLERMAGPDQFIPRVQVRPFNLKSLSHMRSLDPVKMDSLLSVRGMIVRSSPIIPDLKVAHFQCCICGHDAQVRIDRGRIQEPHACPQCACRDSYSMVHNRCIFADKQLVRLQETPDEVPAGQTPASVVTFCFDDLVDSVKPGDRVEVTGVLRAQPRRVNPKISKLKSVYKTYIDVIHFRRVTGMEGTQDATNESRTSMQTRFTPERVEQMLALSKDPQIYTKLTQSLAPSIWELDDVKKGVLAMMFGGNHVRVKKGTAEKKRDAEDDDSWASDEEEPKSKNEEVNTKLNKRGDINILLCGDPGTSKSQLLSYVNKLSSRGVYTSGKGSSAVGLTASVVRDPETRELVLESGALVLSDLGICCIDEFDKMSDTTRSVLHEAMEQQTVSIAKAGIIASLNARTSILASANPTESRYNPSMSVVENIKLPPTLLSRFDLIYLILDAPNQDHDRRLAQHLVGLYYETPNVVEPPLDQDVLRDYVEYARDHIHPELSENATKALIDSYLDMRKMGNTSGNGTRTISATPRQLESLIRLSEALAKMRYSDMVTAADAKEAVRLMRVATQAAATDPRTGRIDMDMITTGRSSADRELEESIENGLKELFAARRGTRMAVRDITSQLSEILNNAVEQSDIMEALGQMEANGVIQFNERAQTAFVRAGVVSN